MIWGLERCQSSRCRWPAALGTFKAPRMERNGAIIVPRTCSRRHSVSTATRMDHGGSIALVCLRSDTGDSLQTKQLQHEQLPILGSAYYTCSYTMPHMAGRCTCKM